MGLAGGIIGGIVGGLIGGPWGAAIGAGLGACLTGKNGETEERKHTETDALNAYFLSLGKLAKADGIVTRNEADFVTELLRSLECPSELKKQLIASFNRGKTDSRSFVQCVRSVASFYPERERRQTLMRTYCILAIADGSLDEGTQHLLESAEEVFHLPGYLASFIRENCRTHTAEEEAETPHPNNAAALEEAYRLLEISPSASDDEVRRARRKKLMDYHPDRIQGKGLPETFLRFAAEETRKINDAYEIISAHRGMKS